MASAASQPPESEQRFEKGVKEAKEANTPAQLADDVYGFKDSIEKRFPDVRGALRMKEIDGYMRDPVGPTHISRMAPSGPSCCGEMGARRAGAIASTVDARMLL